MKGTESRNELKVKTKDAERRTETKEVERKLVGMFSLQL